MQKTECYKFKSASDWVLNQGACIDV